MQRAVSQTISLSLGSCKVLTNAILTTTTKSSSQVAKILRGDAMNRGRQWSKMQLAAFLAASLIFPLSTFACGLAWTTPRFHFDSVQEQGRLSYHEDWGKLKLSDGTELPLIVNFDSGREWSSPVLGQGWMFAFTDSYIVKESEKWIEAVMPNGRHFRFVRRNQNDKIVWEGTGKWLGEETVNGFKAWAPCGWSIEWTNGKIARMTTPKGVRINFSRSGDQVTEVREIDRPLLSFERNPKTGKVSVLRFNQTNVALAFAERPLVQVIRGKNVINSLANTLSEATWTQADQINRTKLYEFGVNDKIQPTLSVAIDKKLRPELFTWDPETRFIILHNEWTYQVEPDGSNNGAYATISRVNPEGQREERVFNTAKGYSRTVRRDGSVSTREWFVRGPAKLQTRRSTFRNSSDSREDRYQYDQNGKLLRHIAARNGQLTTSEFRYNDNGNIMSESLNGLLLWNSQYDTNGRLLTKTYASGEILSFDYLSKHETVRTKTFPNGGKLRESLLDGRIMKRMFPSGLEESFQYDDDGFITKHTDTNGVVWTFSYNKSKEIKFIFKNGKRTSIVKNYSSPQNMLTFVLKSENVVTNIIDSNGKEAPNRILAFADLVDSENINLTLASK